MIARLFLLLALAIALPLPATAASTAPAASGHRFVFLVDASTLMEPARKVTEQAIEELIASGANGQMQAGDDYVLWPYRLKVINDAFPPTSWSPTNAVALAKSSGDFLRGLKYEGAGLFYVALVEAFRVIKASPAVTVFLVSDGAEMLQGTPFDLYANTIYRQRATQLRRDKKPFITALLALDSNVIDCTVGVGGEPLTVPAVPPEARAKPASPPVATTAAPVAAKASAPAAGSKTTSPKKSTPQPTPAAPKPAATTPQTPPPVVSAPATTTPATPPVAVVPASTVATAPAAPPATTTPAPPPIVPVVTAPTPPPAAPAPRPAPAPVPEPTPIVAAAPPNAPLAPDAPTSPASGKGFQLATFAGENRLLVIGAGLLLVAGLVGFILLRRPRSGPENASLITRSMKR